MQVETYEVEEIKGEMGTMAADAEAIELMEKLGLHEQLSISNQETLTRFPYRLMTPLEYKVYHLIFPKRDLLEKFNGGIIPLRILQVAAFCKEFSPSPLHHLSVWHTGVAKEDPLLVGHTKEWGGEFYILGRWGDALETFEALTEKAKKLWLARAVSKAKHEIGEWNAALSNLTESADELFTSGDITQGPKRYELTTV